LDATVVTLATPAIGRDLHGMSYISLVFSSYMLTAAITTPIYGKLSDLYGRKRMLMVGMAIFLVGSVACAASPNMPTFIGARAVQGIGDGSLYTLGMTIVGDVFPISKQARVVGILSTVWSIAGVAGPFVGGLIIDNLSWHWLFYLNVPFVLLSMLVFGLIVHEQPRAAHHRIDYGGAILLTIAILCILVTFLLVEGIDVARDVVVLAVGAALTIGVVWGFVRRERRAREPFVPLQLLTRHVLAVDGIAFLASVVMLGMAVYLPIFLQSGQGYSATIAGLLILPQSLSWTGISLVIGRPIAKYGVRRLLVLGNLIVGVFTLPFIWLSLGTPPELTVALMFLTGLGYGIIFTVVTVAVQESVDNANRGAVMGIMSLARNIGSALGTSIFGAIFNVCIVASFAGAGFPGINPNDIYTITAVNPAIGPGQVTTALTSALDIQFIVMTALNLILIVIAFVLPKARAKKD
jgi:EmrB/QacA subfamily drug resistance transporter